MTTAVKEDSNSVIANKVYTWCGKTRNRYPTKKIECLSVSPPKYKVTLNVEGDATMVGSGEATSIQAAERAAVTALHKKLVPLMQKQQCNVETLVFPKDNKNYKASFTDHDRMQPWFSNVKAYVDAISIMHTRQPSKVVQAIEMYGRVWVTLSITLKDKNYVSYGVAFSKTEAIKLAAASIAHMEEKLRAQDAAPSEPKEKSIIDRKFRLSAAPEALKGDPPLWKCKPRMIAHEIFLDMTGRTPRYIYIYDQDRNEVVAHLPMWTGNLWITGVGSGCDERAAGYDAAFDFCQRWFGM